MADTQSRKSGGRSNLMALPEDDATLAQAAKQNPAAFAELYRRHENRVYRYLMARVGNIHHAQDLTAQTFLAGLEGIGTYRGQGEFAAWILGVARRKAADHFRRGRTMLPLEVAGQIPYAGPPVDEAIDQQLRLEQVAEMLNSLTPDRAEALSLRIFGGLTAAEIGQLMGKSEAAVKMLVHRAMCDLRERLAPNQQESESHE